MIIKANKESPIDLILSPDAYEKVRKIMQDTESIKLEEPLEKVTPPSEVKLNRAMKRKISHLIRKKGLTEAEAYDTVIKAFIA